MKLVLKYSNNVKLYTQDLSYCALIDFIEREFSLKKETINLSYIDDDNDQIGVSNEEDLNILETISESKSYVKMNIKGEQKPKSSLKLENENKSKGQKIKRQFDEIKIQNNSNEELKLTKAKVQKKEDLYQPKKNDKKEQQKVKPKEKKVKSKDKKIQEKSKPKKQLQVQQIKMTGISKFNKLMARAITTLVDERIQALVPCIREQVHQNVNISEQQWPKLIHQNAKCKSCSASPIIGILYSCPKCQNFTLCSECEQYYYHQHNMLKIKREESGQTSNKIKKILKELYEMITNVQQKQEQVKPKSEPQEINQECKGKCKELKKIFGGKIGDYVSFVESKNQMSLASLIQKYCEIKALDQKVAHNQYVEVNCKQLAAQFKTEPQQFKKFVEQNGCLEYKALVKLYKQKLKQQSKKQQKQSKKQKSIKKEANQIKPAIQKIEQKKQEKKKYHYEGKHQQIFNLMVQFFGQGRSHQYPEFIEAHLAQGIDKIIELWSNNVSMLY